MVKDPANPTLQEVMEVVGHNKVAINFVWMLIAGFLVMFMQAGFAMVETGFCRAKNAAHTMSMNFMVYAIGMLGYGASGLWTTEVTHYFLVALFAAIPAVFVGRWLNQRMRGDAFLRYVHAGVVAIGIVLLIQALRHR